MEPEDTVQEDEDTGRKTGHESTGWRLAARVPVVQLPPSVHRDLIAGVGLDLVPVHYNAGNTNMKCVQKEKLISTVQSEFLIESMS